MFRILMVLSFQNLTDFNVKPYPKKSVEITSNPNVKCLHILTTQLIAEIPFFFLHFFSRLMQVDSQVAM